MIVGAKNLTSIVACLVDFCTLQGHITVGCRKIFSLSVEE